MAATGEDEKFVAKIGADEKRKIEDACDAALKWLDANLSAEKEEFEHRLNDIENICSPIVSKLSGHWRWQCGA